MGKRLIFSHDKETIFEAMGVTEEEFNKVTNDLAKKTGGTKKSTEIVEIINNYPKRERAIIIATIILNGMAAKEEVQVLREMMDAMLKAKELLTGLPDRNPLVG